MAAGLDEPSDDVTRLQREVRHLRELLDRREQELRESQAVAQVGSWTTDLSTFAVSWSPETHRISRASRDVSPGSHGAGGRADRPAAGQW